MKTQTKKMKKNSLQSIITIVLLTIVSFYSNAQTFRERILPTEENFGFHQDDYWI